jgi:hypothetical protein
MSVAMGAEARFERPHKGADKNVGFAPPAGSRRKKMTDEPTEPLGMGPASASVDAQDESRGERRR